MRKKKFVSVFIALLLAAGGCSSASAEKPPETLRTVKTAGISAYIPESEASEDSETAETFITTVIPASESTSVSKITHHYDTTIPETLVGGPAKQTEETPAPSETAPLAETSPSTAPTEVSPNAAPAQTTKKTTERSREPSYGYEKLGESGILVIRRADGHYLGLMPCWGTYSLCESWAESVNELKRRLLDVNIYHMIVPTSSEFYVPTGWDGFTASQKNKIDHAASFLENVTDIDAYSALEAHLDEEIYARTDHHWLPLGGDYAAEAFTEAAGLDFPVLSRYEKVERGGYVGSLYGYAKDEHLKNDPEVFTLYLPPNNAALKTTYYDTDFQSGYESALMLSPDASGYYCSFLGSDDRIAKIETDVKNGRKLVIFKESYGNALVPFLTSSFEEIYVCDIRYFSPNAAEFCESVGATDVLTAVCTFTVAGSNGNYLKKILGDF